MDDILKQDLLEKIGLERLPPEKQEEILLKISELILTNVVFRVSELLNDEEKASLNTLLSEKDHGEKALRFLEEKIPNLAEILQEEIISFKQKSFDFIEKITKNYGK